MIKLPFGYYMDADKYNIILGIPNEVFNKKRNKTEIAWKNPTYHQTPAQALNRLYQRKINEKIQNTDGDIQTLIYAIKEIRDTLIDEAQSVAQVQVAFKDK